MAGVVEINSREYKVMLDQRLFVERKKAAASFWKDLTAAADRMKGIDHEGEFDRTKKRVITFLDTPDGTIRRNGFVFRKRSDLEKEKSEYTLKCRSPERYAAAGANVVSAATLKGKPKFEEDIAAPFFPRYSHSNTVEAAKKTPKKLEQAAQLFPALGTLVRDGERCPTDVQLQPTNSVEMFERVLTGPAFRFKKVEAEVALILWSNGEDGRPLVAEFSFRYAVENGAVESNVAASAMEFFTELQRLDWCVPDARTKTQYVYQEN